MSFSCPTCGQALTDRPSPRVLIETTPLGPMELKIVQALLPEFGSFVSRARLRTRVYGYSQAESRAEQNRSLASALQHANQKLSARGLVIEHVRGGHQRTSHRLIWIVEQLRCEQCGAIYPSTAKYRACPCGGRLVPMPLTTESESHAA